LIDRLIADANNRMEIQAAIEGLAALRDADLWQVLDELGESTPSPAS
jgi:ribonuclease HI